MFNINEQIKLAMKNYMQANETEKTEAKMKLDTLKMVKTTFMEYVTNKKNAKQFDINDDVNVRVTKIPENISQKLIEEMIAERVNNLQIYHNQNRPELEEKEKFEAQYLEMFIPKVATKEEIETFLNENYPDGFEQKMMGAVIGTVKKAFTRVDGKMVADIVKSRIV